MLGAIEGRLAEFDEHPALKLTPEQHARALERAGAEVTRNAIKALRDETDAVKRERQHLATIVGTAQPAKAAVSPPSTCVRSRCSAAGQPWSQPCWTPLHA